MTKKQNEALDEGDLDQDVSEPDNDKIEQGKRRLPSLSSGKRQGQNQKCQHGEQRNRQHEDQDQHAEIHFPINSAPQALLENVAGLNREEKKWSIVADGRNIVRVGSGETLGIVAGNQVGKRILGRFERQIQKIQLRIVIGVAGPYLLRRE